MLGSLTNGEKTSALLITVLMIGVLGLFTSPVSSEQIVTPPDTYISQFGPGFDEVVIASSSDGLDEPRDLEFHPGIGRSDELWVVNRADDSMVILHETGTLEQTSEERLDAYRNHFMEEVSAIAFGAYHDEFDYQFGTARRNQEIRTMARAIRMISWDLHFGLLH